MQVVQRSALAWMVVLPFLFPLVSKAEIKRKDWSGGKLVLEFLADGILHVEVSNRVGPVDPRKGIYTTPMVDRDNYAKNFHGPVSFQTGDDFAETNDLRVNVFDDSKCITVFDKQRHVELSTICASNLEKDEKTLSIKKGKTNQAYGVGNLFGRPETADGDWVGRKWDARNDGNFRFGPHRTDLEAGVRYDDFHGGGPSVSQFPVLYLVGDTLTKGVYHNSVLFLDHVYRMSWDFTGSDEWKARTWGDQLRYFVLTGDSLRDLRKSYMRLVGKPMVPPKSVFGLWISEFGYDNWGELKEDLDSLVANNFPVDGVALDLQWFGAAFDSDTIYRMGTLDFNKENFPDPKGTMASFLKDYGIRFMPIEESYIDRRLIQAPHNEYSILMDKKFLAWDKGRNAPVDLERDIFQMGNENTKLWWGRGGMMDWSNPAAGALWHSMKRLPLASLGIFSHWLDLGEPEMYFRGASYYGFPELGKTNHGDIHNVYNLFWAKSIHDGYFDEGNQAKLKQTLGWDELPRYFTMSRAGTIGSHRYGALWSGDVGRNMGNYRAHENTQMHLSFAGVDHYGSDAGGFLPASQGIEEGHTDDELYTQWFAGNSLTNIPLRPHGWANDELQTGNIHFTPDRRGHLASNRANTRLRYQLVPYLYTLAHIAHREGEAMFPPPLYYYQDEPKFRGVANQKMLGPTLMMGIVAGFGQTERPLVLPKGTWIDVHSNEWMYGDTGRVSPEIPLYRERDGELGLFTPPLVAKAGAIIPLAALTPGTRNVYGMRKGGSDSPDLRVRVFADEAFSSFTLYEDDGLTMAYLRGDEQVRRTEITQRAEVGRAFVTVHPAKGQYSGAPEARAHRIELVVPEKRATSVAIEGKGNVIECGAEPQFNVQQECWRNSGRNFVEIKGKTTKVSQPRTYVISLEKIEPKTSVNFVCSNGATQNGEAIYVSGNIPELGEWDPARAVRLLPVRYEKWRRWAKQVFDLPANKDIEWKCLRRAESGGQALQWGKPIGQSNYKVRTGSQGLAGTTRGEF